MTDQGAPDLTLGEQYVDDMRDTPKSRRVGFVTWGLRKLKKMEKRKAQKLSRRRNRRQRRKRKN